MFCYIDDILIVAATREECKKKVAFVRSVLQRAGFVESLDKFQPPTQVGVYLGLELNLKECKVFTPAPKMERILEKLRCLGSRELATPREVAKVYGLLISTLLATGQQLLLLVRKGYAFLDKIEKKEWDEKK